MTGLTDFHEGTWIFKRDDLYYLCYADNNGGANQLRHATSSSPLGPWSYKGVYLRSTSSDTSHGSVVEYKGQWWAFYHTADLSGTGLLRSICVDSLFFNENGTIKTVIQTKDKGTPFEGNWRLAPGTIEAEDFNEGGQGIAYWDNTNGNGGSEYRLNESVDISRSRRYGIVYVTGTEPKEYLNYSFEALHEGIYEIDFVVGTASHDMEEKFYLEFDQAKTTNPRRYTVVYADISELLTITVPNIQLTKGTHSMTFYPSGDLNFDKFIFRYTGTGIKTMAESSVSISSNLSNGIYQIKTSQTGVLSISDIHGKLVLKEKINSTNHTIDISKQASGIYILSIQMNNRIYRNKLIKL
jgi:hypothetical protein